MKKLIFVSLLLLFSSAVRAQISYPRGSMAGPSTVALLPVIGNSNLLWDIRDGNPTCASGGGTTRVLCRWNGATYSTVSFAATPSGSITASGYTMATARLLGRNTASTGAIEEITLGTNLSFSGTTLNAAGSSPTIGDTQVAFGDGANTIGGDTGFTYNKTTNVLTNTAGQFISPQGSLTGSSTPFISHTATWNNAGTAFQNIFSNVTDTNSDAASRLVNLQVGGVSVFQVKKDGTLLIDSQSGGNALIIGAAGPRVYNPNNGGTLYLGSAGLNNILDLSAVSVISDGNFTFSADNTNDIGASGATRPRTLYLGTGLAIEATITAGGTTGAQTINKTAGSVNFLAGASSLTVTNSLVTTSSIIIAVAATNDTTGYVKNVIAGSGSFVINLVAACTAETRVNFWVLTPD